MFAKAEVVSVDDEYAGGRIKAIITSKDKRKKEAVWAFPALPKMMHVKPKVGECVIIFTEDDDLNGQRLYLGPVISQPQYMYKDDFVAGATNLMSGNIRNPLPNIMNDKGNTKGCFAKDDEVAIYGRKNCDIILSDNDIRIRCGVGVRKEDDKTQLFFNTDNPAFIKLERYTGEHGLGDSGETRNTVTVVGEQINLLSKKGTPEFKLNDVEKSISDEEMKKILEEAHCLPYGDVLVDFLKKFLDVFNNHTHPYSGMPPIPNSQFQLEYNAANLEDKTLSKNVRIN